LNMRLEERGRRCKGGEVTAKSQSETDSRKNERRCGESWKIG